MAGARRGMEFVSTPPIPRARVGGPEASGSRTMHTAIGPRGPCLTTRKRTGDEYGSNPHPRRRLVFGATERAPGGFVRIARFDPSPTRPVEASTLIGVIGNGPATPPSEEQEPAIPPPPPDRVVVWYQEAERLLESLRGVLSARVVGRPDGSVEEVHVLTTDDISAKQTVRNVESALAAQYDVVIDHRKISVAQTTGRPAEARSPGDPPGPPASTARERPLTELPLRRPSEGEMKERHAAPATAPPQASRQLRATEPQPELPREPRLIFMGHAAESLRSRRLRMRVSVEWRGRRYVGEAAAADLARARLEGFALATLRALEAALHPSISAEEAQGSALSLDGVQLVEAFDRQFVLVAVNLLLGPQITRLTGAAAVDDSKDRAVILATLQAADRRVRAFLEGRERKGAPPVPDDAGSSPDPFDVWA